MTSKQKLEQYLLQFGKTHSWTEFAEKFQVTKDVARHTWRKIKDSVNVTTTKNTAVQNYVADLEDKLVSIMTDNKTGNSEFVYNTNEPIQSLEDLIKVTKIDTTVWNIDKYIQNYWGGKYQVKAFCSKINEQQNFTNEFINFLSSYKPVTKEIKQRKLITNGSCIIINKQDAHLNKKDISGDNDINKRFEDIFWATDITLQKAELSSNLEKIYYVIGSDEFNSEWTNTTTKGTPQSNILTYQEAFQKICDFEISMINNMLDYADVEVIYIPGNHDEYVGWHLINFLESQYKQVKEIYFDTSTDYTKYRRYKNTAMMFNHGDAIKPEKLANMFPVEFRKEWGECDNFYIFIGDKHHNHIKDLNGIEFYQIAALSKAKSTWDAKNGYTCSKAKLTSFVIDDVHGITDIYYQPI